MSTNNQDPINEKLDAILAMLDDIQETQDNILERLNDIEFDYGTGFSVEES